MEKTSKNVKHLVAFAVLFAAVFLLFYNSLGNEFSRIDDYANIVWYGHFARPLNFEGVKQIFVEMPKKELAYNYYQPLFVLTRCIDFKLWKINPLGYHLTNTFFFYLCCLMAYLILLRILGSYRAALAGALLFAAHPVHTEAVTWVMAGGYPMSCAFLFFSFYCYLRSWQALFVISFLTAGLFNPPAIILPFFMLLYDRFRDKNIFETGTFSAYLYAGAVCVLIIALNFYFFPSGYMAAQADGYTAFITFVYNIAQYCWIALLPLKLYTPHETYIYAATDPRFIISAVFLIGIFVPVLRGLKKKSLYAFGAAWFFVGLIPTLSLWKNSGNFGERYELYASLGFSLITVLLLSKLWGRAKNVSYVVFVLLFAAYSGLTLERNHIWHSNEAMLLDTLKKSPGNTLAAQGLAEYYILDAKLPSKAVNVLLPAIALHESRLAKGLSPELKASEKLDLSMFTCDLGNAYRDTGQVDLAIKEHEKALELKPNRYEPYFYLGMDYMEKQDFEAALSYFRKSAAAQPKHDASYQNAGLVLLELGRKDEAIEMIKKAIALNNYNFQAIGLLAQAYIDERDFPKAIELLRRSARLAEERGAKEIAQTLQKQLASLDKHGPPGTMQYPLPKSLDEGGFAALFSQKNYTGALKVALEMNSEKKDADPKLLNNIGLCYYKLAKFKEAEEYYKKAVALNPNYELAYSNLGLLYGKTGQLDRSVEAYEKALAINPNNTKLSEKLKMYKSAIEALKKSKL